MKLIDGWKKWHKFWSTRLGIVGATVTTALITNPNLANDLWTALPSEIKSAIPPQYMPIIGVAIFVVSMVAKFVKQEALHSEVSQDDSAK